MILEYTKFNLIRYKAISFIFLVFLQRISLWCRQPVFKPKYNTRIALADFPVYYPPSHEGRKYVA